jgi:ribosomal protein L40E
MVGPMSTKATLQFVLTEGRTSMSQTKFYYDARDGRPFYRAICSQCNSRNTFGAFYCSHCEQLHLRCNECHDVSTIPAYNIAKETASGRQ